MPSAIRGRRGMQIKTCQTCHLKLEPLNPPVEEYLENKFCIRFPFGWKLMFLRDEIEYGCTTCKGEEDYSNESDRFHDAVASVIQEEIRAGRLIPN